MLRVRGQSPTACCMPRMATNTSTMIKRHFLSSLTLPEFRTTLRASSYVYCTAPCPSCCVKPRTSRVCQSPPKIRMDMFKHRCRLKAEGALKHPLFSQKHWANRHPKLTARFVRGCFHIETCATSILRSFDFAKCWVAQDNCGLSQARAIDLYIEASRIYTISL